MSPEPAENQVDLFILEQIDSVPHLEALLLLWNSRPRKWTLEEMARALYLPVDGTRDILASLKQRGLVKIELEGCFFDVESRREILMEELDRTYRKELIRISHMIHSKASASVREFARAFRFKKD